MMIWFGLISIGFDFVFDVEVAVDLVCFGLELTCIDLIWFDFGLAWFDLS